MSNFSKFMKTNKVVKSNTTYAATAALQEEDGNPVLWTLRPVSTKENDSLRDECTMEVSVKGKPNLLRPKLNTSKYLCKLICASVVEPNLNDKGLQDSYGVMTPEELLMEMMDDPGEYNNLATKVQEFCGFTTSMDDKVAEAKN